MRRTFNSSFVAPKEHLKRHLKRHLYSAKVTIFIAMFYCHNYCFIIFNIIIVQHVSSILYIL